MTDPEVRGELLRLELAIARRDLATIPDGYEGVLDDRFREIGASVRTWSRAETLGALATAAPADVVIDGFAAEAVAEGLVLVTYDIGGARPTNRSSLWVRDGGGRWRLRFHQGTRVPDGTP